MQEKDPDRYWINGDKSFFPEKLILQKDEIQKSIIR